MNRIVFQEENTMIQARRIGHAMFETPDLDRAIDYYTQVNGLALAEREPDRAFLARSVWGPPPTEEYFRNAA